MDNNFNTRRKTLTAAVSCLITEVGFESIEKVVLETLTEMMQSFITEVGQSSKSYCELAGRVQPVIGDVVMGLIGMGIPLNDLEDYGRRTGRMVLPPLVATAQSKQLNILQAGVKQNLPPYIPDYFPPFPDPHAYIRTPTHKQPVTEYEAIREKSAAQKRDLERALTRFVAKTGEQHSLFLTPDNNYLFPLISCRTNGVPAYLNALLPKDQVFDVDETELIQVNKKSKSTETAVNEEERDSKNKSSEEHSRNESESIDNPYLRSVKMPKKHK